MGVRDQQEIMNLAPPGYWTPERVQQRNAYMEAERKRASVVVRPRQDDPATHVLWITHDNVGHPQIWEHRDGQRMPNKRMLYPPGTHNDYYTVGDLILVGEFEKEQAEEIFEDLKPKEKEHGSILGLLVRGLLGIEPEKIKAGRKIISIRPANDGTGAGEVETVDILFLGEKDVVELEHKTVWSRGELAQNFIMNIYGPKMWVCEFLETVVEIAEIPIGGMEKEAIGGLTKWGMKAALKQAAKAEAKHLFFKEVRHLLAQGGVILVKAVVAFIKTFTKSMLQQKSFNELKAQVTHTSPKDTEISKALSLASWEFSKTIIDESFSKVLGKVTVTKVDEILGPTYKQKAIDWLTRKVIDLQSRRGLEIVFGAYIEAVNEANNESELHDLMLKKLKDSLTDFFKSSAEQIGEGLSEELIKEE